MQGGGYLLTLIISDYPFIILGVCVVYWLVSAFTDLFGNDLTITYSFDKLAIWQTSFRKIKLD